MIAMGGLWQPNIRVASARASRQAVGPVPEFRHLRARKSQGVGMFIKKLWVGCVAVALIAALAACGAKEEPTEADATDPSDSADAADSADASDAADTSDTSDAADATDPSDSSDPQDPCADAVVDASYHAWPGDDWESTCPEVQNIDSAKLQGVYDYAFAPGRNTQSVVIIRNGAIVAEWYAEGKTKDDDVTSWSVAKSFLSAVVGIAVERGDLPSIDESLSLYIPEFQGTDKEPITFRHALQMRSGLVEHTPDNIYFQLDQLAWGIERDVAEFPGGIWAYQNGDSMLISHASEAAIGEPFMDYADEVLFEPLGIDSHKWWTDSVGNRLGYCCIDATARDFARLGILFGRGGDWNGTQVVPGAWVTESTTPVGADMPYGMHWWAFENGAYFAALGALNQSIWVFPYFDLVVLRNGLYEKMGDEYRMYGGSYHNTEEAIDWDDTIFLAPLFEAINDNPFN